jgi:hypothetical protein
MKKIVILLSLILIATSAFAAAAPKKAASSSMGLTGVTLNSIGCPAAHFDMGAWGLDVGGTIVNAASTTTITVIARGLLPLSQVTDNLSTYWGPGVLYNSAGSGSVTIGVLLGAEYMFAPKLTLFADLTAFSLTSAGGATNWFAGANAAQIYTGGRLYF